MVDFWKLPKRHELLDYLYRCARCGEEIWYITELNGSLLRHHEPYKFGRQCNGRLELVRTRQRYPEEQKPMRKRSEINKAKPSAEERTVPLPGTEDKSPGPGSDCPACGDKISAGEATKRPDGQWECPHCAAPIKFSPGGVAKNAIEPPPFEGKKSEHKAPNTSSEHKSSPRGDEQPEKTYCGECGTRLTDAKAADGGWVVYYPCGHNRKEHGKVCDPEHAKKLRPVAGSQIVDTKSPQHAAAPPTNVMNIVSEYPADLKRGTRISIEWPSCSFRVSEFNTFRTSSFFISAEVGEGETVAQVAARSNSELRKLADADFEEKSTWYLQKLGLLAKKMKG